MRWSRDWRKFDLYAEVERGLSGEELSISAEEFKEYLLWLRKYRPDVFWGYILMELEAMKMEAGEDFEQDGELKWYVNKISSERGKG